MDFHSLMRRDLQFLCKRNKIPANTTNVAMADALKSLEIVEGLDEYMSQSNAKAPQSPTSLAKQPPITATRTTRRNTTLKAEPQSSSLLVNRSCRLTSKSLAGEMDQELKTNDVKTEAKVAKTPAARSTRKATAATSCSSKVQESKQDELVQSVYSTRRSTRLLEKCMADLSLKTKETLDDKPAKNEDTVQERDPSVSGENDAEVIPGRDLSASMEKEWETLKNDSDQEIGDLEINVDRGDITVVDANTEVNKEKMNDEKESENGLVQVDKQEETLKAICEEVSKKNDADQEIKDLETNVDLSDTAVFDANSETNLEKMTEVVSDGKESDHSSIQVNKHEETFQAVCDEGSKKNDNDQETADLEIDVDLGDISVMKYANIETNDENKESKSVLDHQEMEETIQETDSEELETMVDQYLSDAGDSETEPEEDASGVDSDGTISEADSNQAVLGSDIRDEEMDLYELEGSAAAPTSHLLLEEVKTTPFAEEQSLGDISVVKYANTETEDDNKDSQDVVDQQEVEEVIQEKDSESAKINTFDEDSMVDQTDSDAGDSETEQGEDNSDSDSEDNISEADSNQDVIGSESADEEIILSRTKGSGAPHLEEAKVKTTSVSSPFAAGSISAQFPRPSKSTTPLKKNSALKMVNENKENNMEMMTNVNKGEEAKKKMKKVAIDEDNLKAASLRQLTKMVKELSIESSKRTALQVLRGNNQIAE